jgi:hypothetical protein
MSFNMWFYGAILTIDDTHIRRHRGELTDSASHLNIWTFVKRWL